MSSSPSSTAPATPQPEAYSQQRLDEQNSLSLKEPVEQENRKGDIRFVCKAIGCALESDTSVIVQLLGKPGGSLDSCRLLLSGAKVHSFSLSAAAAGSEFCVKDSSGDIALLTVQIKSTALWDTPGVSFLMADMTVWRKV
ncbi:hypothetical protein [Streptomyces pseudovenezuelae]|uniref:hypothetical protein n=1 Tax=Streptomyces pseudovenezuelae TaxID=67350 RepID=UPI002475ECD1|nr:hypothetical protein [Streptomyces pseudovenezuelae]